MQISLHCSRSDIVLMLTSTYRRIRVATLATLLLVLLAVMAGAAHAQGTIRATTSPVEYVPFEVTIQTSNSYCYDATFPLVGDVQYTSGTLSVVLTHLTSTLVPDGQSTTCGQERKFTVSGLPRGRQTIKVDVTNAGVDSNNSVGARVSETITSTVDVASFSTSAALVNFWTGGFRSTSPNDSVRVFQLTPSRFAMFSGQWDWMEVGSPETNYTFKAFVFASADRLPDALARLYVLNYPDPYRGVYWTIDKVNAQRLATEWNKAVTETLWAVGRTINGACPLGMSPVYQAFHPRAISHRWTQSRAAYATMLSNGYQGDGPSWCAPALRGE